MRLDRLSLDPFVSQLAALCRSERTRAKWVFVPAHAIGLTLDDRLAREGCDWANLRFVTPLDIAIRMAAPFLLERGIDPSEERVGPALMMRLLLDLPEREGYFRPMAEHASISDALWRTVRELRYAGLRPNDLPAIAFTLTPSKHAELIALLSAYERHLEANRVADMPTVLDEAVKHQDWCPIAAHDLVTELPDVLWSPLVKRFLDSLPGQRIRPRAPLLPDVPAPARADRLAAAVERVEVATPTDASRLRFLQSPAAAGSARDDGTLDLFHAGGRDAEVDEVFRRILASGQPLDQVEIVCASETYPLLVWEKATLLGWPVTVFAGIPAASTRPGRLLLRFCDWIDSDFAARDLRRLLQSGDAAPQAFDPAGEDREDDQGREDREDEGGSDARLSTGQAARLLLKAQATWGRDTHAPALTRLATEYQREADDTELSDEDRRWNARKAAQTRTLLAWVSGVLATIPDPAGGAGGTVAITALVDSAVAFLEANASCASATDAISAVAVVDALADLRTLGDHRCSMAAALGYLRERVESLGIGYDRPRPGRLHVSLLAESAYDGRRLAFIVGLQEGGVFPAAVEDPVLLDVERKAINPILRSSAHRQDEAVFAALSRLAAIGTSSERVCMSFSCRDTRQFRDTFPSWIVLQAFRLKKGDGSLNYERLAEWLGEPASAVPPAGDQALSDAGWWLANTKATTAARPAVLSAFPSLERGVRAEEQRQSDVFTEFDGYVAIAGPLLDPSSTGRPVSATTLEGAAKCPLRFFMQQGLGVRPIEEGESDADLWLDPALKGSELHALYARVMRAIRADNRKPALKIDQPRLRKWGQERLDELRKEMPPPSDEVFARESREFLEDLDAFIEAECQGSHGTDPLGFEVGFGFPLDEGNEERLASAEPLVIDVGDRRRVMLHGRIDRINRLGPGRYEVVDYKTGGYWRENWEGEFAGGTRLQHALYGLAAASLRTPRAPKARIVQGVYLFTAVKGHRQRKVIVAPPETKVAAVLRDLTDILRNGAFLSANDLGACDWCEFAGACHTGDLTGTAAKLANTANKVLQPYHKLRAHK
jgi:PD-(D/E)XK nuclease superfamily